MFACLLALVLAPAGPAGGPAPWRITVMGDPSDTRVTAVREAIDFWNSELARVGSPVRLGPIAVVPDPIPDDMLEDLSRAVGDGRAARGIGRWIEPADGEISVVLTGADLMSFALPWHGRDGGVVVLRRSDVTPLSLPNVARNVAAHELGHILGLPHNSDPATLMCGRPAACRPDLFAAPSPRFFPLTPSEERQLRADTTSAGD